MSEFTKRKFSEYEIKEMIEDAIDENIVQVLEAMGFDHVDGRTMSGKMDQRLVPKDERVEKLLDHLGLQVEQVPAVPATTKLVKVPKKVTKKRKR